MSVLKFEAYDFRNLTADPVQFHSDCNFVVGDNGSGKSSLLEAIFFIGHGKSYRTSKVESLVCHGKTRFILSVKNGLQQRFGIARDEATKQLEIKIDGQKFHRLSDLAKNIAVQIVTPESFKLFFGGPKERRKFVDLGLFHVEHMFSHQWKEFNKVLKHRNACLRTRADESILHYWTDIFCQHSLVIAELREKYVKELVGELQEWLLILLPNIADKITVQYLQGWSKNSQLFELLQEKTTKLRELSFGYSLFGAQKYDVRFILNKNPIENELSRGQQKLFLLALTFAQAKLIERVKRVKPILLIDDVGAELDIESRTKLAHAIGKLNCQVIITAIDKVAVEPLVPCNNNYKMFHVKHGKVSVMSE